MAESTGANRNKSLEEDLAALREDLKSLASTVSDLGKAKSEELRAQMGDSFDKAVGKGRDAADNVQEAVKQRPLTSVLVAFGVGILIGHILDRR